MGCRTVKDLNVTFWSGCFRIIKPKLLVTDFTYVYYFNSSFIKHIPNILYLQNTYRFKHELDFFSLYIIFHDYITLKYLVLNRKTNFSMSSFLH